MRLYLNTSAINRPFDDLTRGRVRLQAEAVALLLDSVERGEIAWIASDYLAFEVSRIPDPERRHRVVSFLSLAAEVVPVSSTLAARARSLEQHGLRGLDALHVAVAESASCDGLVTTDDRMRRRATLAGEKVRVVVLTPMEAVEAISLRRKDP